MIDWEGQADEGVSREEYSRFFVAYGEAMAAWGHLESLVEQLVHSALKSDQYVALNAIVQSPTGFAPKLTIVDLAIQKSTKVNPDLAWWKKLKDKISALSAKRNDLAHHQVFVDMAQEEGRRMFLASTKKSASLKYRRHAQDIELLRNEFVAARQETFAFMRAILAS